MVLNNLLESTFTGFCSNQINLMYKCHDSFTIGFDSVLYFLKEKVGVKYLEVAISKQQFQLEIIDANINPKDYTIGRSCIGGIEGYVLREISLYSVGYKNAQSALKNDLVQFSFKNNTSLFLYLNKYTIDVSIKKWGIKEYFEQLMDYEDKELKLLDTVCNPIV